MRIEPAKLQIVRRDARDQRNDDAAAGFVARQRLRARAFGEPADASPEIDLPARRKAGAIGVVGIGDQSRDLRRESGLRRAGARGARVVADLRKELRARLREHRGRLLEIGDGDLHVVVVRERLGDERVEHRVAERLPPCGVARLDGRGSRVLELRRRVDRRSLVVGSRHAAGERHAGGDGGDCSGPHQSPFAGCASAAASPATAAGFSPRSFSRSNR